MPENLEDLRRLANRRLQVGDIEGAKKIEKRLRAMVSDRQRRGVDDQTALRGLRGVRRSIENAGED